MHAKIGYDPPIPAAMLVLPDLAFVQSSIMIVIGVGIGVGDGVGVNVGFGVGDGDGIEGELPPLQPIVNRDAATITREMNTRAITESPFYLRTAVPSLNEGF